MAYTSPRTWVAGAILTAAQLNAHLRDNLLFLATAAGLLKHEAGGIEADISAVVVDDIIIGTGTGTMGLAQLAPLTPLINEMRDTTVWPVRTEFSSGEAGVVSDDVIDGGMHVVLSANGTASTVTAERGGAIRFTTSGSAGAFSADLAFPDRNPHYYSRTLSSASGAGLQAQGWGFIFSLSATTFDTTTLNKAMFRSITTGTLFAVTGDTATEETTDLTASHTLANTDNFEVFTTDDGVTWKFHIAGSEVASHTATIPVTTSPMNCVVGISNNTTTDFNMECLYVHVKMDRA